MKWHHISIIGVGLLLLGLSIGSTRIKDISSTGEGISKTTIAAHKKLGARYYPGSEAYIGPEMRSW